MGEIKQINIKNRTYYFYNEIIDIKEFDPRLLKVVQKHWYLLCIRHASGYIEEKNGNKYLIFNFVDENKEVLKKYADVWDGIKNKIKAINGDKQNDYGKDYMKIKFNSDDDLPLNKLLTFYLMVIIIRCVFSKDGKFYPQLFSDDALYELV